MRYLVDTGIWLRLFDRSDQQNADIRASLTRLRSAGHELVTCPQNLAEFWNVSARPSTARGGYGQSVASTELRVQFIERNSVILDESPRAFEHWRKLLMEYQIQGLAAHDARLVSMMLAVGVSHILTLNESDFRRYQGISAVDPRSVVVSPR